MSILQIIVCDKNYSIEDKVSNILDALFYIKKNKNHSLAFRSGCKSGVCGSCAIRINGIEKLACKTPIKENDTIAPLKNSKVVKDLIINLDIQETFLKKSKAFLEEKSTQVITQIDEKDIDIESNCILCNSCYSSCPVYEYDKKFQGPFALNRAFRYINDKKENNKKSKIDAIQDNGIWQCTLCGNCNMVCPSYINIKENIIKLRNLSAQFGYNDPNIQNFGGNFSTDFGFNPNNF